MYTRLCIVITILAALGSSGCTDRDRELAAKTGDGTEDFKYVPQVAPKPTDKPSESKQPKTNTPTAQKDVSRSDEFVYKPDPRLSKQMNSKPGK